MTYIDLNLKENNIKLKTIPVGDGTDSLLVTTTISGTATIAATPVIAGAKTGQATVATPGTEVPLHTDLALGCAVMVKYSPTCSGYGYVGNDGTDHVSSVTGYILAPGDTVTFNRVSNLNELYCDSSIVNGIFCWEALDV